MNLLANFDLLYSHDAHADEMDESPVGSPLPQRLKKEENPLIEESKLDLGSDSSVTGASTGDLQLQQQQLHKQQQAKASCPVPGCDSTGHLSGMFERHSSRIGCPVYHNTTPEECVEKCKTRREREEKRKEILDGDRYCGNASLLMLILFYEPRDFGYCFLGIDGGTELLTCYLCFA